MAAIIGHWKLDEPDAVERGIAKRNHGGLRCVLVHPADSSNEEDDATFRGPHCEEHARRFVHRHNLHHQLLAACEALVDWIATKPSDLTWEQEKEGEQPAFYLGMAAIAKAKAHP